MNTSFSPIQQLHQLVTNSDPAILFHFEDHLQVMFLPTLALQHARALRSSFLSGRTTDWSDRERRRRGELQMPMD